MGPGDYTPTPEQTTAARVATLWQAIFGVSGSNGLSGSQKACKAKREAVEGDMLKRIVKLEIGQARLALMAGVGSGLVVLIGGYALKALFGG